MTYIEIQNLARKGKIGMLPRYQGYFKWDYNEDKICMENGDFKTYDLDDVVDRTDFYYII